MLTFHEYMLRLVEVKFTQDKLDQLVVLVKQGKPWNQIARELGVSPRSVRLKVAALVQQGVLSQADIPSAEERRQTWLNDPQEQARHRAAQSSGMRAMWQRKGGFWGWITTYPDPQERLKRVNGFLAKIQDDVTRKRLASIFQDIALRSPKEILAYANQQPVEPVVDEPDPWGWNPW